MKLETISKLDEWDRFAGALTALCRKHGIGLEGAVAYAMEGDDRLFAFHVETDGKVTRA